MVSPVQRLDKFQLPAGFRGRSAWAVQLWWVVQASLFAWSPQILYPWRRVLLRLFGADIGVGVRIRSSARVTFPWKLQIGAYSWIGDDVVIYSLGSISIGANTVVSQKSYLCAGTHDHASASFSIEQSPIVIGEGAWVAADVFVGPGVTIGAGCVVGARSSVFTDLPEMTICLGYPARVLRPRVLNRP